MTGGTWADFVFFLTTSTFKKHLGAICRAGAATQEFPVSGHSMPIPNPSVLWPGLQRPLVFKKRNETKTHILQDHSKAQEQVGHWDVTTDDQWAGVLSGKGHGPTQASP